MTLEDKLLTVGGRSPKSNLLQPTRIIRFEAPTRDGGMAGTPVRGRMIAGDAGCGDAEKGGTQSCGVDLASSSLCLGGRGTE